MYSHSDSSTHSTLYTVVFPSGLAGASVAAGGVGCETSPPGPLRTANQGVAEPQPTLRDGSLHPHPPCVPRRPPVHQGLMRSARAAEQGVLRAGGDGRLRHHALSDDGGGAPPTMMPPGGTAVDGCTHEILPLGLPRTLSYILGLHTYP